MSKSETGTNVVQKQKNTQLCWLYATAESIHSSMSVKLDQTELSEHDEEKAKNFLNQKSLVRTIRQEICFGLIPKTLKRKFS